MKTTINALALLGVVAALAGCGGGGSGSAQDVQDGANAWFVENAGAPTDVGKAYDCKDVTGEDFRFRCTIDFGDTTSGHWVSKDFVYTATFTCDVDGLCSDEEGAMYFRITP